jgi:gp16 family phage-associated protein
VKPPITRTPEEVRRALETHGIALCELARFIEAAPPTLVSVLAGRCKGKRGQAHRIYLALGLKPPLPGTRQVVFSNQQLSWSTPFKPE